MEAIALIMVVVVVVTLALEIQAQQFSLVHRYVHLEGSPANSQGRGASQEYSTLLKAHDRRRLAAFFALNGSSDPSIGLYYTQITLGTPPQNFHVQVDTGSNVLWLNCAPCSPNCAQSTSIPGLTLQIYDPTVSSTATALGCTDPECVTASDGQAGQCTATPPNACEYFLLYGDMSTTEGYIIQDVLTFQDSPNTTATANIFFGCGTNQTGNLVVPDGPNVDGLIGFGQPAISVPSQLAAQGIVGKAFAHCLLGDSTTGGGSLVIGNVTDPSISYTPMVVPAQPHYNVVMENVAVNGVNVSDPSNFELTNSNGGTIFDSGSTAADLIQPAFNQFLTAVEQGAPVPSQQISNGNGGTVTCWSYSGDVASTFPAVTLYFDGGAAMNLGPTNYLYLTNLTNGQSVWCMGWHETTSYTLFGDIVLKNQLVVYDNYNLQIGWMPFDCTQPIPAV